MNPLAENASIPNMETNGPNLRRNKGFIKILAWGLDELSFGASNFFSGSEGWGSRGDEK